MDVDPAASMRCWAIDVELAGRVFTIPALPAADWWPVLIRADPATVLDLLTSTDAETVDDILLTGELDPEALTDAVEQAAGRPFMAACVLAAAANLHWPVVNGQLARRGFRWDVMPLGAALDAVHLTLTEGMDEKDRVKFLTLLDNPVPGRKRDRKKGVEDFEVVAGPRPTTGVTATGAPSEGSRPRTRQRPRPPRQDVRSTAPTPPPAPPA